MRRTVQLNKKQKVKKQNRATTTSAFFMEVTKKEAFEGGDSQLIYFLGNYDNMIFKIKKIHPEAKTPAYALPGDAGMDLYSIEDKNIEPMMIAQLRTGLDIELPPGTVGLVWDKSGLATKHGITVMGGVFDENYRGELIVSLINLSHERFKINSGDKIAQLLIQQIERPEIQEVEELSSTARGRSRLGSTGNR